MLQAIVDFAPFFFFFFFLEKQQQKKRSINEQEKDLLFLQQHIHSMKNKHWNDLVRKEERKGGRKEGRIICIL